MLDEKQAVSIYNLCLQHGSHSLYSRMAKQYIHDNPDCQEDHEKLRKSFQYLFNKQGRLNPDNPRTEFKWLASHDRSLGELIKKNNQDEYPWTKWQKENFPHHSSEFVRTRGRV